MSDWQRDKRWSDRFIPEIKRHLGEFLIGEPHPDEDALRNTDLTVLRLDTVRIGCRVRTNDAFMSWPDEFTIRTSRPSGVDTELTKIIEGWGDYLFYAFCDPDERVLVRWTLVDLKRFRVWYMRELTRLEPGEYPGFKQRNRDGSSDFHAFNLNAMPSDLVAASSWKEAAA